MYSFGNFQQDIMHDICDAQTQYIKLMLIGTTFNFKHLEQSFKPL
jgi:hypothetical protein